MFRPYDQNIREIINFNKGVNLIIIRRKSQRQLEKVIEKQKVYEGLSLQM